MKKILSFALLLVAYSTISSAVDVKISALPSGGTVTTTDQIPVNRAGTTNRVVVGALATKTQASLTADVTGVLPAANGGALGANPTAVVGATAVNGTATTYMRSDASAPLDLTAAYSMTGLTTYAAAEPRLIFRETDQGTDLKMWNIDINNAVFALCTRSDADVAGLCALTIARGTTTNIGTITLGNATNSPTITTAGTSKFLPTAAIQSGGTKFTATGCSNTTTVGGAIAGSYASGTTGTCTVVVTLPAATNGWVCAAYDVTTPTDSQTMSASTTTSCTITGTTVTADVVKFMAMGY